VGVGSGEKPGGQSRGEARWAVQGMERIFVTGGYVVHGVQVKGVGVEGQSGELRRDRGEQVVGEASAEGWRGKIRVCCLLELYLVYWN